MDLCKGPHPIAIVDGEVEVGQRCHLGAKRQMLGDSANRDDPGMSLGGTRHTARWVDDDGVCPQGSPYGGMVTPTTADVDGNSS
jgi:hypothetical protein